MNFEDILVNFIRATLSVASKHNSKDLSGIDVFVVTPSEGWHSSFEPKHEELSTSKLNVRKAPSSADDYSQRKEEILQRVSKENYKETARLKNFLMNDRLVFINVKVCIDGLDQVRSLFYGAFSNDCSLIYGDLYNISQLDHVMFYGFMLENGCFLEGCFCRDDFLCFDGVFESGLMKNGTLCSYPSQSRRGDEAIVYYKGDVDGDGTMNGQGQLYYLTCPRCIQYEGRFQNNTPHGFGKVYYASKASPKGQLKYCGYMKNGLFDGKGIFFKNNAGGYVGSVTEVFKTDELLKLCSSIQESDFNSLADSVCWKEGELFDGKVVFNLSTSGTIQYEQGKPTAVRDLYLDGYYCSGDVCEAGEEDTAIDCGFVSVALEGTVVYRRDSAVFFYKYHKGNAVEQMNMSSFTGKKCIKVCGASVFDDTWNQNDKCRILIDETNEGTVVFEGSLTSLSMTCYPFSFSGNGYFYFNKHRMYRATVNTDAPVYKTDRNEDGVVTSYYCNPNNEQYKFWVKKVRLSERGEEGVFNDGMFLMEGVKRNGKKEGLCILYKCNDFLLNNFFSSATLSSCEDKMEKVLLAQYCNDQIVSDVEYYNAGMITVYHQDGTGEIYRNDCLYYKGEMEKKSSGVGYVMHGHGTVYYGDMHYITGNWDQGNPIKSEYYEYYRNEQFMETTIMRAGAMYVPHNCRYCRDQLLEYINISFDPLRYQIRRIRDRKELYNGEVVWRDKVKNVPFSRRFWVFIPKEG